MVTPGKVLARADGVSVVYPGDLRAVNDLDFEIAGGELVALIGPNGAGKSSLLRVLAGLLEATTGSVQLGGQSLDSYSARERARLVAVVPQALAALPEVTVARFVASGRYAHRHAFALPSAVDRKAVERALEVSDLHSLAQRALRELSGGQRQRALVARALAQEADLLLVDEPTNGLDPGHQMALMDLFVELARAGKGVLVATHDLNLASQAATRVVLLQRGKKRADASVDEVLSRRVLEPVYGSHFQTTRWPVPGGGERPVVLPWRGGEQES